MEPRIFYIHIPRCGGTTIGEVIQRSYEPQEIYTLPSTGPFICHWMALSDRTEEEKAKIKICNGHIRFGTHVAFDGDPYTYATIVRDPVELVYSIYNFHLHGSPEMQTFVMDLYEFALYYGSIQMQMLLGSEGYTPSLNENADRSQVTKHLKHHFSYVGLFGDFRTCYDDLCAIFGWDTRWYGKLNAWARDPITEELRDLFYECTEPDRWLYEYVRREIWHEDIR